MYKMRAPIVGGGVGYAAALHDLRGFERDVLVCESRFEERERDKDAWSEDCGNAEKPFN